MHSPRPPAVTPAALNERELEILRLLAGGHTVKSIAAGLGRSEASINERLREARRKTGIGSSRELARLLAAQKIWDRKIDLPGSGSGSDKPTSPQQPGRRLSKGSIAMLLSLPSIAAGLLFAVSAPSDQTDANQTNAAAAAPATPSPLAGRWALEVGQIPEAERPRAVTISFAQAAGGRWSTVVEIVGADGATRRAVSTAAADGVPVPVSGSMGAIDSVALRQPEPGTLVMTLGKDGHRVSTRVYTVAKDGKTMTETIVWAAEAMPPIVTTTFTRIG